MCNRLSETSHVRYRFACGTCIRFRVAYTQDIYLKYLYAPKLKGHRFIPFPFFCKPPIDSFQTLEHVLPIRLLH